MQAEAWEIAKFLEEYTAAIPAEFSRIHGDDERVSVAAFRRAVIDHRAIFEAVVHDWRQFERHGDHSGLACGQGRNRTTDTRILSIRLYLSTEFSIDPNVLIQLRFPSVACLRMF